MTTDSGFDARKARQVAIRSLTSGATIVGGTIVVAGSPVDAASFVVTNTNDSGAGSLAQAVTDANAAIGVDTITFANGVTGTINTADVPDINDNVVINGPGEAVITLTNLSDDILYLYNAGIALSGVTLSTSSGDGLGSWKPDDVTVTDVTIRSVARNGIRVAQGLDTTVTRVTFDGIGNDAVSVIYSGDVSVVDVEVTDVGSGVDVFQSGTVDVSGSAISSRFDGVRADTIGALTVTDTTVTNANRGIDASGVGAVELTDVEVTGSTYSGAQFRYATSVDISSSQFADNGRNGISVNSSGLIDLDDVTLADNNSNGADFNNSLGITVTNSDVRMNRRSGLSAEEVPTMTVTDTIIADNRGDGIQAEYVDDLVVTDVTITGSGSSGIEGSYGINADLTRVVVSGGRSDGVEFYDFDTVEVRSTTISDNLGDGLEVESTNSIIVEDTNIVDHFSTGILVRNAAAVTLHASTVSGSARAGISVYSVGSTGLYLSTVSDNGGAAIETFNSGSSVTVLYSTISGNAGPVIRGSSINPMAINIDHSVVTGNNGAIVAVATAYTATVNNSLVPVGDPVVNGNIPVADPMLSPLGDFGGPTLTRPPMTGSPAIDSGDPLAMVPVTDQRRFSRLIGSAVDIGSVEFDAGVAGMAAATRSIAEDAGTVPIVVNRTGTGDGAASVLVSTAAGSAASGADFTGVSQTVSWAAGEIGPKTVNVPILTDELDEGSETFTVVLSAPVGVTLGATTTTVTITNVVAPPDVPAIVPVAPARYLDTRPGEKTFDTQSAGVGRALAGQIVKVKVAGRGAVPADAVGVVANLTAIAPGAPGFATLFPCGATVPTASHVNYFAGEVVANNVVVPLNAAGEVCIFTLAAADYAMDVNGYVPAGSPVGLFAPTRFLDTREGEQTFDDIAEGTGRATAGQIVEVQVAGRGAVPSTAAAVMVNVTSIFPDGPGFATLFPCGGTPPEASTLNYFQNSVVPNGAITKLSPDGKVCIYTLTGADFALDVAGYVPAGVESLVTLSPVRVLETREGETTVDGQSQGIGRIGAGEFREVQIAGRGTVPADATAALLNVATVFPDGPGFVTLYPCGTIPTTSNLNHATGGTVRANNAITKLTADGKVCVFTLSGADIIIDLAGYLKD